MDSFIRFLRRFFPEIALCAVALFFAFRELSSFPAPWEDSGLYSMIAKSVATGHGYSLPILRQRWAYPYFISVGPTVILPVALLMYLKNLGCTWILSRMATAVYLLLATGTFYAWVRSIAGRSDARYATWLLISLSAFVNNGKPVLGTVPAFFYLCLGLFLWGRWRGSWRGAIAAGICFGLAALSKLTFGLVFPALGIVAVDQMIRRERTAAVRTIVTAAIASAAFVPWIFIEIWHQEGFVFYLIKNFGRAQAETVLSTITTKMSVLPHFQYSYFAVLFVLGTFGFVAGRFRLPREERMFVAASFLLFLSAFLLRENWYRLLLPAHLLLLPFVPAACKRLFGDARTWVLLGTFVIIQGVWQLDHRGSSRSTAAMEAVRYVEEKLANVDVLIQHPEIFVELPDNPHWLYFPLPGNRELMPENFTTRSPEELCMLRLRKANEADRAEYGDGIVRIAGKYALIPKSKECTKR